MSCSCILSHVLHSVPCRPRGTRGAGGRCISSISLSLILFPVTHLTTVRSSSSLVVPCDISGSSNFFVIAYYITMKEFLSKQRDTQGQNWRWHLWFTKHIKHQNLSTSYHWNSYSVGNFDLAGWASNDLLRLLAYAHNKRTVASIDHRGRCNSYAM